MLTTSHYGQLNSYISSSCLHTVFTSTEFTVSRSECHLPCICETHVLETAIDVRCCNQHFDVNRTHATAGRVNFPKKSHDWQDTLANTYATTSTLLRWRHQPSARWSGPFESFDFCEVRILNGISASDAKMVTGLYFYGDDYVSRNYEDLTKTPSTRRSIPFI